MSDAKVTFALGEDGKPRNFSFACPHGNGRCGKLLIAEGPHSSRHGVNQNGLRAQWHWNGDRERPTFSPSVNCFDCWHGYIENGRCVSTAKVDEPEPA
jgi:hypothetical protein